VKEAPELLKSTISGFILSLLLFSFFSSLFMFI
jgi:hypothetical protein